MILPKDYKLIKITLSNILTVFEILFNNDDRKKTLLLQKDKYGNNGLHLAIYDKSEEDIKLLIDSGIDINTKNDVNNNRI